MRIQQNDFMNQRLAFATYDFSNSGYVLIFQSLLFPLVLDSAFRVPGLHSATVWGWIVAASSILAIVSAPFLGRLADRRGKAFVFTFTVLTSGLLSAITSFIFGSSFILLAVSFLVYNTIFELSQSLYDSFLVNLAKTPQEQVRLSTFAWGFGYLGGAVFITLYLIFSKIGLPSHIMLFIFGILFVLLSVPSMRNFKKIDPKAGQRIQLPPLREIFRTSSPVPWKHLFVYWIIADSVAAIMYFAPLYVRSDIGLSIETIGALMLGAQVLAFPATILMGKWAIRVGSLNMIKFCLVVWVVVLITLYFANSLTHFVLALIPFVFVVGTTQSLLRAHYVGRINEESSGEALGYYAIAQKSASVLAPLGISLITIATGSLRLAFLFLAVLVTLAFFLTNHLRTNNEQRV